MGGKIADVGDKKKKRAATKHVATLGLEDLAKYFDLPIVEASKQLKVGLTVLKKKCRQFGIPRWPHRKIKSLDCLIHDLQVHFFLLRLFNFTALEIMFYDRLSLAPGQTLIMFIQWSFLICPSVCMIIFCISTREIITFFKGS